MADAKLLHKYEGNTLFLTINNPKRANNLSAEVMAQMQDAIDKASIDDAVTTIVLTAVGKYFCTGMDLSSLASLDSGPAFEAARANEERYQSLARLFESINSCPKITIALVNGSCYGGGNGLVFVTDIRIAVASARFILSEVKRGLTPAIISRFIVREWGPALAREAMITGRGVSPQELHGFGGVHHIVEGIEEGRRKLGQVLKELQTCAPGAQHQSKRLVNSVYEHDTDRSKDLIRRVFLDMTKPNVEAKHGVAEFQKGVKNIDWAAWSEGRKRVKL
ncbi:hypothetical protein EG329_004598 [Mollisiaceae sp. DMI_Dod_QoI]|nr:hypothetical protein EG329_004598 [Helotiales sp. DMI_Dod_QoI]